ncbi:MAG: DnaJ domain-containing protein [Corynebacteriales bacterium]|nr:DnaJ domain-containing protein [Mycobacteriales bacterium]
MAVCRRDDGSDMSSQLRSLDGANPYEVLGVAADADDATIASAHRRLIRQRHPDAPGGSEEAAKLLNAARDVLLDDLLRAEYDARVQAAAYAQFMQTQPEHDTWADYHAASAPEHESPNAHAWDAAQSTFTRYDPPPTYNYEYAQTYTPPNYYAGSRRPTANVPASSWSWWAIAAAFLALVFPPAGFVIGIMAYHLIRYSSKRGLALSIAAIVVSLILMARSALLYGTLFSFGGFSLYLGLTFFAAWMTWVMLRRFR